MIVQSKLSDQVLHIEERVAAIRFIFLLPLGQPFGVSAFPDYVFTYIFEVGMLEDLPWVKWVDDDTGSRIYRWRRTENPAAVYQMSKDSPLFRSLGIDHLLFSIRHELMDVDRFEKELLNHCIRWRK